MASGEACNRPTVHIWEATTMRAIRIIRTFHKNGIINLAFSRCGQFIISLGIDKNFSISVQDWKTEEIIAIRNTGSAPIFDIIVNPFNKFEFDTSGY